MNTESKSLVDKEIQKKSKKYIDPAKRDLSILDENATATIADECKCCIRDVYISALSEGIYPFRYVRNLNIMNIHEQLKLAESTVAVVGAGGLGGQVILMLARLGIGKLIVIDHDSFDETNLNRQALSSLDALGQSKVQKAASTVKSINPGVEVKPHHCKLEKSNAEELLEAAEVIVDALDNIPTRLTLGSAAKNLKVPLVHGAIAGFEGQVMTIFPEDKGLINLYGEGIPSKDKKDSPEAILGVPVLTPSTIACFQAMEVFKVLLKRGKPLQNKMLYLDLEAGQLNEFSFDPEK